MALITFLREDEMKSAEYAHNTWTVTVPAGVTIEWLQEPIYWTHVATKLRQWDVIRAQYLHSDGMWLGEFIVIAVDDEKRTWAKLKLLKKTVLAEGSMKVTQEEPLVDKDFEVKFRGGQGWSVLRKQDQIIMFERGKHSDDANRWVRDYRKKTAA